MASSSFVQRYPVSNPLRRQHRVFGLREGPEGGVRVGARRSAREGLCEDACERPIGRGTRRRLLVFGGNPYQIHILDIASHQQTPFVKHPDYDVLYGRLSPDNRWISFTARVESALSAASSSPPPMDPSRFPKAPGSRLRRRSPKITPTGRQTGRRLYFTSSRDGYSCLWGQRIEASSRRPVGEAFAVQHLHGRLSFEHGGWSAAAGRIGHSARRGYRQHLDDVTLRHAVNWTGQPVRGSDWSSP